MHAAAVITTANHGLACPGEELVYVCVSQGTSQRWRWLIVGSQIKEHIYSRTAAVGTQEQLIDENQNVYNLMLNSTDYNAFTSTISAIATLSMHNIRLECTGQFPTSVVIQIAGLIAY